MCETISLESPFAMRLPQTKLEMEKAKKLQEQLESVGNLASNVVGQRAMKVSTPMARALYTLVKQQYVYSYNCYYSYCSHDYSYDDSNCCCCMCHREI